MSERVLSIAGAAALLVAAAILVARARRPRVRVDVLQALRSE